MDPFTLSLGVSAAGAAASWWNRQQQADAQRDELEEALRRARAEKERVLGETRARGAASGVEFESASLQRYVGDMSAEFDRRIEWLRSSGMRAASLTGRAANMGLVTDLGGSLFQYGQSNNWWKKPAV
jgi:hypothetical protein